MGGTGLSTRTLAFAGGFAAVIAAIAAVVSGGIGGETLGLWVADLGSVAVTTAAAIVIIRTAGKFGAGEPYRRYWLLAGIGVAVYAMGDLVWSAYELTGHEVPYPGVPDLFYLAEYLFLGVALFSAALAYRALIDMRTPIAIDTVVVVAAAAALWILYLGPSVAGDAEISMGEKILSIGYPLADVFVAFAPALLLLLVIRSLSGGRIGWPWIPVAIGAVLLAVSDTGYSLASAAGTYQSGDAVDYGWMAAHALIAIGALTARDVTQV